MNLDTITPLILTFNEENNIQRTLSSLYWAKKIIVIDSYSTDTTLTILRNFPQIQIIQRKFDTFANQANFGLAYVQSEWVLSIDADYVLTPELISEIQGLPQTPNQNGFWVSFKYCVFGAPLNNSLLPPRTSLYRVKNASYCDDGHAHRIKIQGQVGSLTKFILHDDRKPFSRWIFQQDKYAEQEAEKILCTPYRELSLPDKVRATKCLGPILVLFYCLIIKGTLWNGWRGWYYTFQRVIAECLLTLRLIEKRFE